jgi:hypothetical protein
MSNLTKPAMRELVIGTINRCYCDFGQKRFRKVDLLYLVEGDDEFMKSLLDEWTSRGFLRWLMSYDEATPQDEFIEFVDYIEGRGPVAKGGHVS